VRRDLACAFAAIAIAVGGAASAEPSRSVPPPPTAWVSDPGGALTPAMREAIDARLERYQRTTGRRIMVLVDPDTSGAPIDGWTRVAFGAWSASDETLDDGVLVVVMSDRSEVAVELGVSYSMAIAGDVARIAREAIVPRLRSRRRDDAIAIGVDGIVARLDGRSWSDPAGAPGSALTLLIGASIVFVFVLLAIYRFKLAKVLRSWGRSGGAGGIDVDHRAAPDARGGRG
jgi:uncharacterized membrane protein YgcG